MANLYTYQNPQEVAEKLAAHISQQIYLLVKSQSRVTILLSGGSTPKILYEILAQDTTIPWNKIHIFWSDERFVKMDSHESNYRMISDALLVKIKIPQENIHPINTNFSIKEEAAKAYEEELKLYFNNTLPRWDINILGIGEDCHMASLFPHSPSLQEKDKWVVGVDRQKLPPEGITLTFPILNSSKNIYILATGKNKANALKRIIMSSESIDDCPASGINPVHGDLEWWVDKEATKLLGE